MSNKLEDKRNLPFCQVVESIKSALMKIRNLFITLMVVVWYPVLLQSQSDSMSIWKQEIIDTEAAFAQMVKDKGISEAFLFYAAENAVLKRDEILVIGKPAIRKMMESQPPGAKVELVWAPDFVDVSLSGDMAYTYGNYTMKMTGPDGKTMERKGVFHTVWKRQKDGLWKYVWD